jgi:hypothetical protein
MKQLFNLLRTPQFDIFDKLLMIFCGILAILSTLPIKDTHRLVFGFCLMIIAMVVHRVYLWFQSRRAGIVLYRNWSEAPERFKVEPTLRYIGTHKAKLEIVGRTCFRWLCGKEDNFESQAVDFVEEEKQQRQQIRNAIIQGGSISFVVQNPYVPVPVFNREQNSRLRRQCQQAISSFQKIVEELDPKQRQHIDLFITNEVVDNSMVRIFENSKVTRFIFDLSIKFKSQNVTGGQVANPFLVFKGDKGGVEEYGAEFAFILKKAIPKEDFDHNAAEAKRRIEKHINGYPYHSRLRQDTSKRLAWFAALQQIDMVNNPNSNFISPPACIQLLVTNKCVTKCVMCDHHKLADQAGQADEHPELRLDARRWFAVFIVISHSFGPDDFAGRCLLGLF